MLEEYKFHRELRRLQGRRKALLDEMNRRVADVPSGKDAHEKRQDIQNAFDVDFMEVEDDISRISTTFYYQEAVRRFVEIPPDGEPYWEETRAFNRRALSSAGISKIRTALYEEHKQRWERFYGKATLTISVVTALTGLGGVIIGILSFMKDKH